MEYRNVRGLLWFKRLWRYRYRFYALIIIVLTVFIVGSDTTDAVSTLVSKDSLTTEIVSSSLFGQQVRTYVAPQGPQVEQIVYRGADKLFVNTLRNVVTQGDEKNYYDNYGFVLKPPIVDASVVQAPAVVEQPVLNDIVRAPYNPERKNYIEYPRFSVQAPLVYTVPSDIYERDGNGNINYSRPITEDPQADYHGNYTSIPILRLLLDGVVVMTGIPGIPYPGELGNSYLVGHSSNFSSVVSPYREIFKDLVNHSAVGDEFYIYDAQGRKLKFRVFEIVDLKFDGSQETADAAYGYQRKADASGNIITTNRFSNRRVVTLQTCRSVFYGGYWYPTYRWLTRGELVPE